MYLAPTKLHPFHVELHAGYDPALNALIKQVPGVFWGPMRGGFPKWHLPRNALGVLQEMVGTELVEAGLAETKLAVGSNLHTSLRPYQAKGVHMALQNRVLLSAQEMRMGKTLTAIEAMRQGGAKTALIVGPAVARPIWIRELKKWWPDHPDAACILPGKPLPETPFLISSYEGLTHVPQVSYDAIIFDESFYLKDSRSKRSQLARTLRGLSPGGLVIALSGMPISSNLIDLWAQLDILQPYAWGTFKQFAKRYCLIHPSKYSDIGTPDGVNEAFMPELQNRLSGVVQRVVKSDYPGLFPPLSVDVIEIAGKAAMRLPRPQNVEQSLVWLQTSRSLRLKAATEWAEQTETGVVFTWLKETATEIAAKLDNSILITGDETAEKRQAKLDKWKPGQTIVATMASCKTAIDLSFCNQVLFAELYWSPEVIGQAMMRLHHMEGRPLSVYLLKIANSLDEALCATLGERLLSEDQTIGNSAATAGLASALQGKVEDQETWAARLMGLVGTNA